MPRAVDPDEKRAGLVQASWDVIAAEGLRAATLRRVASEAGCTTGALTHYFPDRRALLIGALRAAHAQAAGRMARVSSSSSTPFEALEGVLWESLPLDRIRLREWRVWLAFWAESMNDRELAKENARRYAEWRELLGKQTAPLVRDASARSWEVSQLVALVDGYGLRIARHARSERATRAEQEECRASLERYLERFAAG